MRKNLLGTMPTAALLVWALAFQFGCQNKSNRDQSSIPDHLDPQIQGQMQKALPVSDKSRAVLIGLFKTANLKIPTPSLLLDSYSSTDKEGRERDLAKLDGDGRDTLKVIKEKCIITPGKEIDSGDIARERKIVSTQQSRIEGDLCPIKYSNMTKTVTSFSNRADNFSGSSQYEAETSLSITDSRLKALATTGGYDSKVIVLGRFENYTTAQGDPNKTLSGIGYSKGTLVSDFITADNSKVPITAAFEMLAKPDQKNYQALFTLKFPDGDATVGFVEKSGQKTYYLNGEQIPESDAKVIYGLDNIAFR